MPQLRRELRVAGLKQPDERTRAERAAHGLHFGELVAAAEDVEELRRLPGSAAERPQLVEHDPERQDRRQRENEQNPLGDTYSAGTKRESNETGTRLFRCDRALRLHEQREQRASKRAQTALRDI